MVEVDHVSKSFGGAGGAGGAVRAVSDVSLSLSPGVVTGLLGPNGAGKTTLIRMITGLLTPDSGSVTVCGHDSIVASTPARASLGYLPESAPTYPEMRVTEFLRYRAELFGVARGRRREAVEHAISACWLTEMRRRRIGTLSKGYRQRVGLAAAILHRPRVLVLDEPTTGLDPSQIREMRALIRGLARGDDGQGRVVLLSSHILPEVEQTCDRVVIIARGRVRADGTPAELLAGLRAGAPYRVEAAGGEDASCALGGALERVPGVARIEAAGPGAYLVHPAPGANDLREPLARAAAGAGVLVRELHRATPTLEQVFVRVVETGADGGRVEAGA